MSLEISGITWILSYQCNLNCSHCFFDVKGTSCVLDCQLAKDALESLEQKKPLAWQHVSGGEPLLFKQELYQLLEVIQSYGTSNVGIATNGFWGKSEAYAQQIVTQLRQRGVNGVCLSADHYHQPQLPLTYVQTAAEQVYQQGLEKHSFVVCCYPEGEGLSADPGAWPIPFAPIPVRRIGGGGSAVAKPLPDSREIPDAPCRNLCCCLGETSPFDPQMVWVDPYGNVMICYGLVIGNLNDQTLGEILRGYSIEGSKVLQVLAEDGPIGLYLLAVSKGWQPEIAFVDECDLCWHARSYLRSNYPEVLKPEECYPLPSGKR